MERKCEMMELKYLLIGFMLLICSFVAVNAQVAVNTQNEYSIPACSFAKAQNFVGDSLRLPLPKGAKVRRGRDIDYESYSVSFGKKNNRFWLSGIFGPTATSGKVSEKWLSVSSDIVQRSWKFAENKGVDAKGKLANGNYWRYVGRGGESLEYYDVPKEAAEYFDGIIGNLCYQAGKY